MWVVIIALIVFGIATVSVVIHAIKTRSIIWSVVALVFSLAYGAAIIWGLKEFVTKN